MMLTNSHTGTRIDEVAPGIYRINTPLRIDTIPGGFNLSQYLTASEAMRKAMDYYAHSTRTGAILECLASLNPTTLACQHGSAYCGNGAALLRELAAILEKELRAALM